MYATTKIRNIADSATIRESIPTRPREGIVHGDSTSGCADAALLNRILLNHSYFQSGSSGCLRSQSGRLLWTVGVIAKLYSGGGEAVDHSRVQASQGSFPAIAPRQYDHRRFATNKSTATPWKRTPMETSKFQISHPRPGS